MMKRSDLIMHPVRMRIVLEIGQRQMTTRQLADVLPDVAQATLYRQIKRLHDGGVLRVADDKVVNGAVERSWALVAHDNRLSEDEVAAISAETHIHYFSIFAAGLLDSFTRYVENANPPNFSEDGMSYNQATIYLSDAERNALQEKLNEAIKDILAQPATEERKRYTLASVVIPDERETK